MSSTLVRLGGIAAFVLGTSIGLTPMVYAQGNLATPPPVSMTDKCEKPENCQPPPQCKPEDCPPQEAKPPAAAPPAQAPAQPQQPEAKPVVPTQPQVEQKPVGGVQAGGGVTAQDDSDVPGPLMAAGGAAVIALSAAGAYVHRRQRAESRR